MNIALQASDGLYSALEQRRILLNALSRSRASEPAPKSTSLQVVVGLVQRQEPGILYVAVARDLVCNELGC